MVCRHLCRALHNISFPTKSQDTPPQWRRQHPDPPLVSRLQVDGLCFQLVVLSAPFLCVSAFVIPGAQRIRGPPKWLVLRHDMRLSCLWIFVVAYFNMRKSVKCFPFIRIQISCFFTVIF